MTRVGIEPETSRLIAGYLFHCAIMAQHISKIGLISKHKEYTPGKSFARLPSPHLYHSWALRHIGVLSWKTGKKMSGPMSKTIEKSSRNF